MGQASASKIRWRVREREGVARFIAEASAEFGREPIGGQETYTWRLPGRDGFAFADGPGALAARRESARMRTVTYASRAVFEGAVFDAHAAREAAESMLREAVEVLAVEQVFVDWTRSRGKGPENRVAFWRTAWTCGGCGAACAKGDDHRPCQRCGIEPLDWFEREVFGGWPGDLARHPDNPSPSWTPMARARARLGRRVLAAIVDQPSECSGCSGCGERRSTLPNAKPGQPDLVAVATVFRHRCPDCHGTGHNLRGTLQTVEWSVAQMASASDGAHAAWNEGTGDPRTEGPTTPCDPAQAMVLGHDRRRHPPSPSFATKTTDGVIHHRSDTRVAPRGTHRIGPARGKNDPPWTLDQRINGRGWAPKSKRAAAEDFDPIFACLPAWRRGETRAQETKFRRAWEAVGEEYEGQWWMPRAAAEPEAAE